ncbi:MAG TPA: division/cell wall cluster transcriptional repressor MraZ [Candidatus Eisenbacteria bacterium]|nr:division/cell wall cluster transcriptional repressor MraZ [Candidatus Eisenbacteria bacterium]
MATFRGSYQHSVDHKGRVSIPARFRRSLSGDAEGSFVVLRGFDACVSLFPSDEFKSYEERLRSRSFGDEAARRFQRLFLLDSRDETLDAQGRVAIPPRLLEHAKITKDVLVNGVLDHIEIWDPKVFEQYLASSNRTYEDIAGEILP